MASLKGEVLVWGETEYQELWGEGYPQEHFSSQGNVQECTRQFLVPWADRQQAVYDFLGYAEAEVIGAGMQVSRQMPHFISTYLRQNGLPYLYADDATIEPFGVPMEGGGNAWQPVYGNDSTINDVDESEYYAAKMTVHYSTRNYRIFPDWQMPFSTFSYDGYDESSLMRYVEIQGHPQGEYLSLPEGSFALTNLDVEGGTPGVTAGTPVPGSPGKTISPKDITLIWRQVPRLMVASSVAVFPVLGAATKRSMFDYAIGTVNASAFLGFPPDTLLCEPMEMTPWIQCDGEVVFDITFHFKYLQTGHNYFLTKNAAGTAMVYSQIAANSAGASYSPGNQTDGETMYDARPFQYLFFGYSFSAGLYG